MRNFHNKVSLLITLFLVLFFSSAWGWNGKVVGISDGDTIEVMHNGRAERIRLYGIDCPESHQDFGQKAKQFTASMVFGKNVEVERIDTDRYGRTVGVVSSDGKILNAELVKSGLAWYYARYCKMPFCSKWLSFQEEAKAKKIGLWAMKDPIPPWDFKRSAREGTLPKNSVIAISSEIYHGNTRSMAFHKSNCKNYNCKNCTVVLKTREEAISKGFHPCGICRP